MRWLLAATFLACGQSPADFMMDDPKVRVAFNGFDVNPDDIRRVIKAWDDSSMKLAVIAGQEKTWKISRCAEIEFRPYPFACSTDPNTPKYHGCQPVEGFCSFEVGYRANLKDTAIIDELAHYTFEILYNYNGEVRTDGTIVYLSDYRAFIEEVYSSAWKVDN